MADSGDPDSNTGSMPEDTSAMRYATISEIRLLDNDDDFPPLRPSGRARVFHETFRVILPRLWYTIHLASIPLDDVRVFHA